MVLCVPPPSPPKKNRWSKVEKVRLHLSGTVQVGKYLERRKVKKPDCYQEAGGPAKYYTSQVYYRVGKYLERRKVEKPDRYQEAGGPAEYYSSQVQYRAGSTWRGGR